jgi:hypothetical protein
MFTLFVVPSIYVLVAKRRTAESAAAESADVPELAEATG